MFAATRLRAMELNTILNHCHHFRGFVYEHSRFSADKKSICNRALARRKADKPDSGLEVAFLDK